jgi:hypothetical protein
MSALPPKADIGRHEFLGCSALKRSASNLALPTAIGLLVDLSLSFEPARDALSGMMTLIARYHAGFFGNRAAE